MSENLEISNKENERIAELEERARTHAREEEETKMSYYCLLHNWSSPHYSCPNCQRFTTSTSDRTFSISTQSEPTELEQLQKELAASQEMEAGLRGALLKQGSCSCAKLLIDERAMYTIKEFAKRQWDEFHKPPEQVALILMGLENFLKSKGIEVPFVVEVKGDRRDPYRC